MFQVSKRARIISDDESTDNRHYHQTPKPIQSIVAEGKTKKIITRQFSFTEGLKQQQEEEEAKRKRWKKFVVCANEIERVREEERKNEEEEKNGGDSLYNHRQRNICVKNRLKNQLQRFDVSSKV